PSPPAQVTVTRNVPPVRPSLSSIIVDCQPGSTPDSRVVTFDVSGASDSDGVVDAMCSFGDGTMMGQGLQVTNGFLNVAGQSLVLGIVIIDGRGGVTDMTPDIDFPLIPVPICASLRETHDCECTRMNIRSAPGGATICAEPGGPY